MKLRTIILISIIGIAVIGVAGYYGFSGSVQEPPTPQAPQTVTVTKCDVQQTVEAPAVLSNISETQILMPVDGHLLDVLVQAGDSVSAGQILARLDDQSKAEALIAIKDAQEAYQKAYNYRKSLNGETWLTQTVYHRKGNKLIPEVKSYRGYPDPETIQDADNDLALKKAQLDNTQSILDNIELKAPFSGILIDVNAVMNQPYHADDILFKIIDSKALEVKANVTQEDYPLLETGQNAVVYFDARPDVIAQGKVDRIVPKLIAGDSPTYDIFISLDEVPDGLVDGMTADVNVTIASRQGVLCLPRSVVHASADNKAELQVWNGVGTETRQVTTGLRGDSNVEILSGLEKGEQVVVR